MSEVQAPELSYEKLLNDAKIQYSNLDPKDKAHGDWENILAGIEDINQLVNALQTLHEPKVCGINDNHVLIIDGGPTPAPGLEKVTFLEACESVNGVENAGLIDEEEHRFLNGKMQKWFWESSQTEFTEKTVNNEPVTIGFNKIRCGLNRHRAVVRSDQKAGVIRAIRIPWHA